MTQETGKRYDFDEIIPREGTNSVKYDGAPLSRPELTKGFLPMWIADMDFACPQPILDAMKRRIDKRILGYSMPLDPAYYGAVMGWMKRRHGWDVDMGSIVFSSGVVTALNVSVEKLTSPGDGVIVQTPGYTPFYKAILKHGRTPVFNRLLNHDGYYTMDFDDLEKKAKDPKNTLFFLCNPQNPTGRVWSEEELRRAADICLENGVFIVSDEIHSDLLRKGQKHIPLLKLYPDHPRIIACTAPSKTFNLAGNHLSNLIIPDPDIAAEWRGSHCCGMPSPLSIDACIAAYNECEDWLEQLNDYLDRNFAFVKAFLEEHLPKAKMTISEGTYLAWFDLSAYGNDQELSAKVAEAGLFIEFAGDFIDNGAGYVRVNLACPLATVKEGMEMLKKALTEPSPRLQVGDTMPGFTYDSPFEKGRTLEAAMEGKPTALLFLRYYGCTVCQLDLQLLAEEYGAIAKSGGQLKVVLQSDPELVAKELGSAEKLPYEIICDPEQALYKRFAIRPAASMMALGMGKGVFQKIAKAKKSGLQHGAYEGEELQLPACFVLKGDRTVTYARYGKSIADIPDAAEIGALLAAAN